MMNRQKAYKALILVSILLVVIVTGFTCGLNSDSFKSNYTNSLIASYSVVASQYVGKIEYALKYGKPLANFHGLTEMLQQTKRESEGLENIRVVSKDAVVLYDLSQKTVDQKLPKPLLLKNNFADGGEEEANTYIHYQHDYHVFVPIYDRRNTWVGSMEMIFSESLVNIRTTPFLKRIIGYSLLLGLISMIILIFLIFTAPIVSDAGEINHKLVLIIFGIILTLDQIVFGAINYDVFKKVYTENAMEYTTKTAVLIQKDINQVINKGVTYQDLADIDLWLKGFLASTPEIERIDIMDQQDKVLYSTHAKVQTKPVSFEYLLKLPLQADAAQNTASIRTTLSRKQIDKKLFDIALDMLTILVISFIFMMEVLLFLGVVMNKPVKAKEVQDQAGEEGIDVRLVRPLGFIVYFSSFLSMTFIPVFMKELYRPIAGLSENLICGLPISMELLCGALGALLAGHLMGTRGWKPIFLQGLAFFGCGALLSGMARGAVTFIIARGVFGVGYGFCLLAMQGYASSVIDNDAKSKGISALTAGSYAGLNCGSVLGAMLAERIGYSSVFFVTLFTSIFALVFVLYFMKNSVTSEIKSAAEKKGRLAHFFADRKLWAFFLFVVIPTAVCSMFLEYFLPLYSKTAGASSADVGRVFLLNGLAIVYLGPTLSGLIKKYLGYKSSLVIFVLVLAAAMLIFAQFNSFAVACVSAVVLGIAMGIGDAVELNYLFSLKTTENLGEGMAIGFLNVTNKIGQTFGPLIFGLLMALGSALSIGIVGWSVLGLLLLFIILSSTWGKRQSSVL